MIRGLAAYALVVIIMLLIGLGVHTLYSAVQRFIRYWKGSSE